ncbi:MAG: transcriptional regulator, MucR family [Gammaproteobacteria bacterium]|nr:transcriptional regulator, MucR family [Gammaproteobacteria bacterium]
MDARAAGARVRRRCRASHRLQARSAAGRHGHNCRPDRSAGSGGNHTTRIVSAYAGKAPLSGAQLTEVIGVVSRALIEVGTPSAAPAVEELTPAVPVKKSVSADFIECLEDGKKLKMLKRHLMSTYGMTPAETGPNGACRAIIR